MKQHLSLLFVALSFLLCTVLCGCNDTSMPTPTSTTPAKPFIAAIIDGEEWNTESVDIMRFNDVLQFEGVYNNKKIKFRLVEKFLKEGTTLSLSTTHNAIYNDYSAGSATFNSFLSPTGGTLTITLLTAQEMEGTFAFAGTDNSLHKTVQINRGRCRMKLP